MGILVLTLMTEMEQVNVPANSPTFSPPAKELISVSNAIT